MVAAIGAAAAVGGAAISANGAQQAAGTAAASGNNSLMWNMMSQAQTQNRQQPFVDQGTWANQQIENNIISGKYGGQGGTFTGQDYLNNQDPGYGFQLSQGQQALQNSQAAGSGVLSGAALKGLIGYNQGMASTGYQNAYNRWLSSQQNALQYQQNSYGQLHDMASLGQNAAAQVGNTGASYASSNANLMTGIGNAQAAGSVGTANALSSGLSNGAGYYALNQMLNQNQNNGGWSNVPQNELMG